MRGKRITAEQLLRAALRERRATRRNGRRYALELEQIRARNELPNLARSSLRPQQSLGAA